MRNRIASKILPKGISSRAGRDLTKGKFSLREKLRAEASDCILFVCCSFLILLIWWLFLGWTPKKLICNEDCMTQELPYLIHLNFIQNLTRYTSYRPEWLGGIHTDSSFGVLWIYKVFMYFGISIWNYLNFTIFLFQTFFAFLGLKITLAFTEASTGVIENHKKSCFWLLVPLTILFAFNPAIAWRAKVNYYILPGVLSFLSILAIGVCSATERLTYLLLLICGIVIYTSFQTVVQQSNVYWMTLGLPFLVGIYFSKLSGLDRVGPHFTMAFALGVLGLAMPALAPMLSNAVSGESARSLSTQSVIYSYLTASPKDWAGSLTWGRDLIPNFRPLTQQHEVNYPLGPTLFLLLLFPWRKFQMLLVGLLLSMLFIIALSSHLEPISSFLIRCLPILGAFRVPMRSALLILPILSAFVAAPLAALSLSSTHGLENRRAIVKEREISLFSPGLIIAAGALVLLCGTAIFLRGWYREIFFIACFGLAAVLLLNKPGASHRHLFAAILLLLIAIGTLLSFKERSNIPFEIERNLGTYRKTHEYLFKVQPDLKNPLVRSDLQLGQSAVRENLGIVLSLSTLTGYFSPSARYLKLVLALDHLPYLPEVNLFSRELLAPALPILSKIYNIRYLISTSEKRLQISPRSTPTLGTAWFASETRLVQSYPELAAVLWHNLGPTASLSRLAPILWDDLNEIKLNPVTVKALTQSKCSDAGVENLEWNRNRQELKIQVQSPGNCLLVLPMNFHPSLKAVELASGDRPIEGQIKILPVYGALTGAIVPEGRHLIRVRSEYAKPIWALLCRALGSILIVLSIFKWAHLRRRYDL